MCLLNGFREKCFCRHDYQSKLAGFFTITYLCNPNPSSWWDWHDLLLSTISCSPSPFSKWDSSQTECFCWRWLGHWWGRCWSSTSHLCRPSSRQRRCMFQVCTTVCALCKNLSSVYTHQLAAISVYTSPCLHPPLCKPSAVKPAQSTPTSVNLVQLIQLSLHPPLWKPRAVTSSSVYTQLFVIPVQITPTPVYTQLILFTALFTPTIVYTIFVYTQVCLHPTHSVYTIVYTHLCLHPSLLIPSADEVSV